MQKDYGEDELSKLFEFFLPPDKKTIGFIELKQMFENLGESVKDSEISAMIIFADKDQDGEVNFQEFCKIMKEI
jgi:Ca2+-binding EF-hand superfamily protein